uniref:Uncharacterized protein n=1 Tax=Anguilla anguilla TaxID=7936 RepID=A0A0E9WX27_ANGAN
MCVYIYVPSLVISSFTHRISIFNSLTAPPTFSTVCPSISRGLLRGGVSLLFF